MTLSVNAMRRLDYYVGVPLCFVGTFVRKLCSLFSTSNSGDSIKNVLFIGLSETGSNILADPAMVKIREALNVNLFFASFMKNSPSLDFLGTVSHDNVFRMRDSGIGALAWDTLRFFVWTRKNRIDTVVDLELFSRFTAILAGFSGAVRRAGFSAFYTEGLYRGGFLTHRVLYNAHQHMTKNYIALVNALLTEKAEVPFSKTLIDDSDCKVRKKSGSDKERMAIHCKIREVLPCFDERHHRVVLFNTNASDLVPLRRWPREHFVSLAHMILDRYPRVVVLLIGVASEHEWNESIVTSVKSERCVNFAGQTAFSELLALYSASAFMVTNDSGPAHFASLTYMPAFVFFGPETPALYGPLGDATPIYAGLACSPCVSAANHRKSPCNDNVCLQLIEPGTVFDLITPRLEALQGE